MNFNKKYQQRKKDFLERIYILFEESLKKWKSQ